MGQEQITMQIMDANRIILENTFAFIQTEKLEKAPWLNPWLEARKKIINKYGKIYKRFYEDCEFSPEYLMDLYKIAGQE